MAPKLANSQPASPVTTTYITAYDSLPKSVNGTQLYESTQNGNAGTPPTNAVVASRLLEVSLSGMLRFPPCDRELLLRLCTYTGLAQRLSLEVPRIPLLGSSMHKGKKSSKDRCLSSPKPPPEATVPANRARTCPPAALRPLLSAPPPSQLRSERYRDHQNL